MAEKPVVTLPPRKELPIAADGKGGAIAGTNAVHPHLSTEALDDAGAGLAFTESIAPAEDLPRLRHGKVVSTIRGDAAHALEPLHQRRRRPGVRLPGAVLSPGVDPAVPP
jgi:hypothetical protein